MDSDLHLVRREDNVRGFMAALVGAIGMEAYGALDLMHYGASPEVKGFTAVQKITTSCAVLHTVDLNGELYLDITSCREFDAAAVKGVIREWFGDETSIRMREWERDPELNPEVPNFPEEPERNAVNRER